MISQSDVDQFQRDGFVVVRDVFSAGEMRQFLAAVDSAIGERHDRRSAMAERDAYDRMFTQHFNLWESSEEVRKVTFETRLAEIASSLLQAPALRVYFDQSFYKEPGSTETGVHQDYTLLSIEETETLTAWIPLEGCTRNAGGLGYLPGSHKLGRVTHMDIVRGVDPLARVQHLLPRPVFLELAPGSVAFHHVLTFHLAAPNTSHHTRKALAVTYFADGSTRGTTWPHPSLDRACIAVGERIEGPATPLVWPRRTALPETPPPNPRAPRGWPGHRRAA
jgi:ectoine hydroxylase-related dioxygenase (phytanoyl-CoA dioxygenase family)